MKFNTPKKIKTRRGKINEVNLSRRNGDGDYRNLFPILLSDEDEFFSYFRMKIHAFYYIYDQVKPMLTKKWCNLHKGEIREEEQLVVTIRLIN